MRLMLDAGNSRLKWAISHNGKLISFAQCHYQELDILADYCQNHKEIKQVFGCAVCSQEKILKIECILPYKINWQESQTSALGIQNHYQSIEEHGADRWFNVLGARTFSQNAVVIVSCGTALAIEALTKDNQYLGGSIAPGLEMMQKALKTGTAKLNRPFGTHQSFAKTTEDALMTGVVDAACGAINAMHQRLQHTAPNHPVDLLLTGGDAYLLSPYLDKKTKIIDNLALHGLNNWVNTI